MESDEPGTINNSIIIIISSTIKALDQQPKIIDALQ